LGVKILKFFDEDPGSGIRDGDSSDPGWEKVGSGIRDKHPGSATLSGIRNKHPGSYCISESLETIFLVKIHLLFYANADPDPGIILTLEPGWKNVRIRVLGKTSWIHNTGQKKPRASRSQDERRTI
jgi:hypothetical protein